MKTKRLHYEAPTIEVVPMEMEGVIAASGGGSTSIMPGTEIPSSGLANPGLSSDIEDLVEQIFTIDN